MYRFLTLLFVTCSLVAGCTPKKDLSASIREYGAVYSLCEDGNQTACEKKLEMEPPLVDQFYERMEEDLESRDKYALKRLKKTQQEIRDAINAKLPPDEYLARTEDAMFLSFKGQVSRELDALIREARENRYVDGHFQLVADSLPFFRGLAFYVNRDYQQAAEVFKALVLETDPIPDLNLFAPLAPAAAYKSGHPELAEEMVRAIPTLTISLDDLLKGVKGKPRNSRLLRKIFERFPDVGEAAKEYAHYSIATTLLAEHVKSTTVKDGNYKLVRALAEALILAQRYTVVPHDAVSRARDIVREANALEVKKAK